MNMRTNTGVLPIVVAEWSESDHHHWAFLLGTVPVGPDSSSLTKVASGQVPAPSTCAERCSECGQRCPPSSQPSSSQPT